MELRNCCAPWVVTMQAQKEAPLDMQCKDKFLVQTVIVSDGTTSKQVLAEMVGWAQNALNASSSSSSQYIFTYINTRSSTRRAVG